MECKIEGCNRPTRAGGMCTLHYNRVRVHGSPEPRDRARGTLAFRFWRKVDQSGANGCWNWTGGTHKRGYGTLCGEDGKTVATHRLSYEMHRGAVPAGLYVRHICDNPRCVNPDHLLIGTPSDNVRDMWERARARPTGVRGEKHLKAKLTEDDVRAIRADTAKSNHQWARELGVTPNSIRAIRIGKNWAHVK